jgi:uncharacterized protein YoxC
MSRASRRGDDYAPAMFPFLAVLLCTIGALVLILVVSVVHSHASAKRDIAAEVTERIEQAKEKSDILESVSEELLARRERVKQEIERRRRELANIEDHIDRLRQEMDGLRAKAKAIETSSERDENAKREHELKIEAIKSEIDKKKQELAEKIREQKQRKPAFSIIPYSGNNGTSRRPVYIECRSDGVVIQPEGVTISIQDLRPPHGPGNPLDAALRILRNTYQQRDATYGISTPPYPLLVVRPDGIHTYALARSAMAGWDDQFGYELVEDDMELAFPPGVPSLAAELEKALAIAKRRQESLLASSPARFARSATEWDDEEAPLSGDAPAANGGRAGNNSSQWGDESETANSASSESESSRWRMVQELQPGQVVAAAPSPNGLPAGGHSRPTGIPGAQPTNPSALNSLSLGTASGGNLAGEYQSVAGQAPTRLNGLPQTVGSGVSSSQFTSGLSNPGDLAASNPPQGNTHTANMAAGSAGNASGGGNAANGTTASGNVGSSQGSSAAGGSAGGTAASGAAASAGNASTSQSSNASNAMSAGRANAFSSGSAGAAAGAGATSSSLDEVEESRQIPLPTPNGSSASGKDAAQGMPSNARHAKESKSDSDTKPISISAGKGWAVSRAEGKATPVSRPIRIVVLADRWLIRHEDHHSKFDAEILLETGPAQAGKELEQAIRQRVDSWGLSLPGGYWAPTVTMESASDAQQSVQRLQRLLEGSGVDVRVIPLQAPTRKSK